MKFFKGDNRKRWEAVVPYRYAGKMVDAARIELATPAMSTQCSTTELRVHEAALVTQAKADGKGSAKEETGGL